MNPTISPVNFDGTSVPTIPVPTAALTSTVKPDPSSSSDRANHGDSNDHQVIEIESIDQLDLWAQQWHQLLKATANADYFHTLDWLRIYWQHYGADQKLRILLLVQGKQLLGILPLVVAPLDSSVGRLRVLTYPLDWWGSFYGPIGPNPQAILQRALEHIRETPRDWDLLELRFVHGHESELPTLADDATWQTLQTAGFHAVKEPLLRCARIKLDGTWDDYLATRRKSWRSNIRRTESKTLKAGNVEHIRYRPRGAAHSDDDPRWDLYDECLRLASQSWQGSSRDGHTLSHDHVMQFLRDCHQAATSAGNLDMNLLKLDGKAVAFHYGYQLDGYFSSLRLGFDPDYAKLGVGTVLTGWMIKDGFERGDHTFDFLPDCLKAKMSWQTSVDVGYRYTHFPSFFNRSQLIRWKRWFDRDVRKRSVVPS